MSTADERALLAATRAGDENAFGRLVAHHRRGLELFCLLMLGCPHAAHDALCETLLRGWTQLHQDAPSASARIWLYRLATDVCTEGLDGTDESRAPRPFDGVRPRNARPN